MVFNMTLQGTIINVFVVWWVKGGCARAAAAGASEHAIIFDCDLED